MCMKERNESAQRDTQRERKKSSFGRALVAEKKRERESVSRLFCF